MSHTEMRLSPATRAKLDVKTRERLSIIERVIAKRRGLDLVRHLIILFHRFQRISPEAAAVVADELLVQYSCSEPGGEIRRELRSFRRRICNWSVRKRTAVELRIWISCVKASLSPGSETKLKRELGSALKHCSWSEYSAYTLVNMAVLFDGTRQKELLSTAKSRISELDSVAKVQFFARMSHSVPSLFVAKKADEGNWAALSRAISAETLSAISTATTVTIVSLRRADSAAMPDVMMLQHLLQASDRQQYTYMEALAMSAYPISRSNDLRAKVRVELQDYPPSVNDAPVILSEFAKFGVVPMTFLASQIKPLMDSPQRLVPIQRMQVLTALATLGKVDPMFAAEVHRETIGILGTHYPWMIFFVTDVIYSFALCDVLQGTDHCESIIKASFQLLDSSYSELNDRERMKIARAALSVQNRRSEEQRRLKKYILPKSLRNSIRRIVHGIKSNPPRSDNAEDRFVEQLRKAMPEANVSAGGFAGTHHLDASVEIDGKMFDAELDGRVHEVYTLFGEKIGQRGDDALRDFNIEHDAYRVVRFTHDELRSDGAELEIRRRFGLAN